MESKNHIILVIMVALIALLVWQFIPKQQPVVEVAAEDPADDGHYIRIHSASWGLNCPVRTDGTTSNDSMLAPDTPVMQLKRDNVLSLISKKCNGKNECEVFNTPSTFNADDDKNPDRNCDKQLEVEYRCFTFDRLWKKVIEHRKTGKITCVAPK